MNLPTSRMERARQGSVISQHQPQNDVPDDRRHERNGRTSESQMRTMVLEYLPTKLGNF